MEAVCDTLQSGEWMPRCFGDLDGIAEKTRDPGLDESMPMFTDQVYVERRKCFSDIAKRYKYGEPLPRVEYTDDEIKTWGAVYRKTTQLFPTHVCRQYNEMFTLMVKEGIISEDNIPQLEDVSDFLKARTGFTLRPVPGMLSSRAFLNVLAFRVFFCAQYVRHGAHSTYAPEPDVCHDILGHMPTLADPAFADFTYNIGIASLGATDESIEKLVRIYWYTAEFGLCKEAGNLKAYGAGLISSSEELMYCLTNKPEHQPLDADKMAMKPFPITTIQPMYFVAESIEDMQTRVREYTSRVPKPA